MQFQLRPAPILPTIPGEIQLPNRNWNSRNIYGAYEIVDNSKVVSSLLQSLLVVEQTFDYLEDSEGFEDSFLPEIFRENNEIIRTSAVESMQVFNSILDSINGIPMKLIHDEKGLLHGRITASRWYRDGCWGLVFQKIAGDNPLDIVSSLDTVVNGYNLAVSSST